jgi:hypothetical protein
LRHKSDGRGWPQRLRAAVCWRVMQPTLGLLWAEAAGHTSYRATWVNVTDGGHYDNLGLVEALRRHADHLVVLDASGDHTGTWSTLGGAIALARADAGAEIDLDPTTMVRPGGSAPAPPLGRGEVVQPWARGTFTRRAAAPAAPGGQPRGAPGADPGEQPPATPGQGNGALAKGDLWVCKLGWWKDVPWDVQAYAAAHPSYPCESTLQQLYDSSEFEAYHALGACAVLAAAQHGGLPWEQPSAAAAGTAAPSVSPTTGAPVPGTEVVTVPKPRVAAETGSA